MRILLVAASLATLSLAFPAQAQEEDLVFSSNSIGGFRYGEHVQRIWASLRNKTIKANEWQFRYDPLFLPDVDENGELAISETSLPNNSYKLTIGVTLDNNKARDIAFHQLEAMYPELSKEMQPNNIFAINVGTIIVSIPEIDSANVGAKLINPRVSFLNQANSFSISISAPTKDAADVIRQLLPGYRIDYDVSYHAKSAKQNVVKVRYKDLRNSSLFAKLNGLGTTSTYVHRDDMRKLTENIHSQIDVEGIIEEPAQFDRDLFEKILGVMSTSVNTQVVQFDAQKWAATYNADDLKPDAIEKSLNKEFVWDEGSKKFQFNGSIDTGGKVSLLDVLSAEGKGAGSYSQDEMQTWLKKHDVEASFEGHKIIPKSIVVQQINMSDFDQDSQFSSIVTLVSDSVKNESGSMDLTRLLGRGAASDTIPTQVAEIWSKLKDLEALRDSDKSDTMTRESELRTGLVMQLNNQFSKLNNLGSNPSSIFGEVVDIGPFGGPTGTKGRPTPLHACTEPNGLVYGVTAYDEDHTSKIAMYCRALPKLEVK